MAESSNPFWLDSKLENQLESLSSIDRSIKELQRLRAMHPGAAVSEPDPLMHPTPGPPTAKFRKKPEVIDAVQYVAGFGVPDGVTRDGYGHLVIATPEGRIDVSDGDWIITNVEGKHYLCNENTFGATYESVAD